MLKTSLSFLPVHRWATLCKHWCSGSLSRQVLHSLLTHRRSSFQPCGTTAGSVRATTLNVPVTVSSLTTGSTSGSTIVPTAPRTSVQADGILDEGPALTTVSRLAMSLPTMSRVIRPHSVRPGPIKAEGSDGNGSTTAGADTTDGLLSVKWHSPLPPFQEGLSWCSCQLTLLSTDNGVRIEAYLDQNHGRHETINRVTTGRRVVRYDVGRAGARLLGVHKAAHDWRYLHRPRITSARP